MSEKYERLRNGHQNGVPQLSKRISTGVETFRQNGGSLYHDTLTATTADIYKVKDLVLRDNARAAKVSVYKQHGCSLESKFALNQFLNYPLRRTLINFSITPRRVRNILSDTNSLSK